MSHLSCSTTLSSSPNIYYNTSSVLIISRTGSDIPTRLDVSPWNSTCNSVAFNQIASLKVQILDCSSYNTSFLVNFTKLTNLDLEFVDQPISKTWFDSSASLQSLTLRNINPISHTNFLSTLCTTKYYKKLVNLQMDSLANSIIPQCIFKLSTLSMVSLELSNMRNVTFQQFNGTIKLFKLKTLNFSSNALTSFPPLLEAIYLGTLDVSNNKLTTLDDNDFPNLLSLIANNNSLTGIPFWYYLGNENILLDLSYNPLTSYVASDIFINAEVRLSGNSWLIDYGNVDCSYPTGLLIIDNVNVNSINAITDCSNNLRFRNSNINDLTGLRSLLSSKTVDISFSPNYFKILTELCMDDGTPKTITIHKNIILPNICTNNTNTGLTLSVAPNCGFPNNLHNLTVGYWKLTCIEPYFVPARVCIKYIRETSYTIGSTSTNAVYNSMRSYSSIYSTQTYTRNATTVSKQIFKWVEMTRPISSSYYRNAKMVSTATFLKNSTAYYNYTGNSTIYHNATVQNSTTIPKFRFKIMDQTTITSNTKVSYNSTSSYSKYTSFHMTNSVIVHTSRTVESTVVVRQSTTVNVDPSKASSIKNLSTALNAFVTVLVIIICIVFILVLFGYSCKSVKDSKMKLKRKRKRGHFERVGSADFERAGSVDFE